MSFAGLKTCKSMIITDCDAKSDTEVIARLCDLAQEQNYVNEIFKEKILEREKEYPTGLATVVPIAIPHIHDGCLSSFFSIATFENPVEFSAMDGSDEKVKTQIVFLFGITDPSYQTAVLRKFSMIFQNEEMLNSYISIKDRDLLLDKLKQDLEDYIIL